jgi:hypothetical protein
MFCGLAEVSDNRIGSANCKSENRTNYLSCGFTVCEIYLLTAHLFFFLFYKGIFTCPRYCNYISLKELQKLKIFDMVV